MEMENRENIKQIICLAIYNQMNDNFLREPYRKCIDEITNEIIEAILEALPKKKDNSGNWSEGMTGETRGYNIAVDDIREILLE